MNIFYIIGVVVVVVVVVVQVFSDSISEKQGPRHRQVVRSSRGVPNHSMVTLPNTTRARWAQRDTLAVMMPWTFDGRFTKTRGRRNRAE